MWCMIDGNSWFHADYHGDEKNCVKNFINRVGDIRDKYKFSRVVIAFDQKPSWRCDVYPKYKADRDPKPDIFYQLFAELRTKLDGAGAFEILDRPRTEADDIIAELAREAVATGGRAVMFSSDKDLHQCLRNGMISQVTKVVRDFGGAISCTFVTTSSMYEKYGLVPSQWVDYRCMTGDPSDNIPGCYGIGPGAAMRVLQQCTTLDGFSENPDQIKLGPVTRKRLIEFCANGDLETFRKIMTLAPQVAPVRAC